jgi:hypothetical protein
MELLPVLLARLIEAVSGQAQTSAPQAELRARLRQEPAEFHPWFDLELRAFAAAPIGE